MFSKKSFFKSTSLALAFTFLISIIPNDLSFANTFEDDKIEDYQFEYVLEELGGYTDGNGDIYVPIEAKNEFEEIMLFSDLTAGEGRCPTSRVYVSERMNRSELQAIEDSYEYGEDMFGILLTSPISAKFGLGYTVARRHLSEIFDLYFSPLKRQATRLLKDYPNRSTFYVDLTYSCTSKNKQGKWWYVYSIYDIELSS